jgi:multicomponent Na+:H+ antiporter subunit D
MIEGLNPALILILGGLAGTLLPDRVRTWYTLVLPLAALVQLLGMVHGEQGLVALFDLTLVTLRLDPVSYLFAFIFLLASALAGLYALHLRDTLQQAAATVYAGAAVGAVLAGDLLTLFVYWELTSLASVFLIWARRSERAYRAGLRYLIVQVASGVMLLGGVALHYAATGSIAFQHLGLESPGGWWIFLAFGIKCAFPLLHNWVSDAYPESTVTGTVVLSIFSTKLAIYALARGFAGSEVLVPIGAVMALFPICYAVLENDLRRVLAYSLNIQLGFMVVGIGIGSELALNGVFAHAFCHILYKSLLFMSMGAVLYRTGTIKAGELGGLFSSMPWTATFCLVGAASIAAAPLFVGFVSKTLILQGLVEAHHSIAWLALLLASASTLIYCGIRVPYLAFFGENRGLRCAEAPPHMLAAMGLIALACLVLGVYPAPLYALLPYPLSYTPYTADHVLGELQLLGFSALAFVLTLHRGWYPAPKPALTLDSDWFYRHLLNRALLGLRERYRRLAKAGAQYSRRRGGRMLAALQRHHGPQGLLARTWPTGSMVLWVSVLLAGFLTFYYLRG